MSREIVTPIILAVDWGTHKTYDWQLYSTEICGRATTHKEAWEAAQRAFAEWQETEQTIEAIRRNG